MIIALSLKLTPEFEDDTNPILRQPIESTEYSRYHLDEIIVVANVEEEISWNGNLSMSCQVKFDLEMGTLTVNNLPSSSIKEFLFLSSISQSKVTQIISKPKHTFLVGRITDDAVVNYRLPCETLNWNLGLPCH